MSHPVNASTGEVVYNDPPLTHDLPYAVCGECGTPYLSSKGHDHG